MDTSANRICYATNIFGFLPRFLADLIAEKATRYGDEMVIPAVVHMVRVTCADNITNRIKHISLSNDTFHICMHDIRQHIFTAIKRVGNLNFSWMKKLMLPTVHSW